MGQNHKINELTNKHSGFFNVPHLLQSNVELSFNQWNILLLFSAGLKYNVDLTDISCICVLRCIYTPCRSLGNLLPIKILLQNIKDHVVQNWYFQNKTLNIFFCIKTIGFGKYNNDNHCKVWKMHESFWSNMRFSWYIIVCTVVSRKPLVDFYFDAKYENRCHIILPLNHLIVDKTTKLYFHFSI